jgi:hypothetical protein
MFFATTFLGLHHGWPNLERKPMSRLAPVFLVLLCASQSTATPLFQTSVSELPQSLEVEVVFSVDPNGSPVSAFELFFQLPPSGIVVSEGPFYGDGVEGQPVVNGIFGGTFATALDATEPFVIARFRVVGTEIGAEMIFDPSAENFISSSDSSEPTVFTGTVATVVPEPGTLGTSAACVASLGAFLRRTKDMSSSLSATHAA